ncbi:MAG: hypothetical protein KatS3mg114_1349 [Planctomycetaceae bacterium]|nr:MAG: hypothetical protein KatS3mg114_1349 [Planctomycetaceae bacterium]
MRGVVMILGWIGVLGVVACAAPPTDSDPARSGYRPAYVALQGAQIVVGDGQVLSPGTLLMHRGQIVAVGAEVTLPAGTEVLDVTGMVVYPGWIDAVNDRLLTPPEEVVRGREVDAAATAVVAMRTDHHRGLTPEYEAGWSLVRDSAAYERHRRAGFSLVHVVPTGRIMSGQTAVVGLADVPPREALLQATWAQTVHLTDLGGRLYPQTLMGTLAHLRQHVLDARRWKLQMELYARGVSDVPRPAHDPVWEALVNLESRHQPLWWCVRSRDDLERVFSLADEQHWPVHVVWGVHEEITRWIPELVRRHVGVVLTLDWGEPPSLEVKTDTDDWPALAEPRRWREGQRRQWLQRAELLRQLRAQGITVALGTQGLDAPDKAWQALRRLVEHGTSPEEVLTALTLGPARLLGLEQRLGTLTPGKLAHVLVTTHPWHHPDAKVRYVFVEEERYEYHAEKSLLRTDSSPESPWKPWLGRWQLTLGSGEHVLPATLELHTQGERLTGRFSSAQGDGQVQHAKKQPQGLQFDIAIGVGDRAVVLHIEAQLPEGDPPARWHGTMRSAFGQPTSFTAVRRPEAQPSSGATLTIEAADDEPPVSALSALTTSDVGSTAGRLQVSDPPRGHCTLAADQTGLATRDALPVELPEDRRPSRPSTGGNLLLKQVSIITGTGQTLPAHDLLIRGGIITAMAPHLPAEPGVTVLELPGWFVMPGIIDTHSHIMLARGLVGVNEATDSVVCEVQVRDIINTSDPQEYRAVAGGCTTLRLLHGSANVIGGQDTIVQLRLGETIAGHLLPDAPQGVKFALGENVKARQERFPNTRMGVEATLQRAFAEALEYRHRWQQYEQALRGGQDPHSLFPPRRDLRLECLAEILSGHRFIHSHCYPRR